VAPLGALRSTFPTLVDLANYIPLPAFVEVREAIERRNNYAKDSLSRNSRLVASDPSRARQTLFTHLLAAKADDRLTFEELVGNAGLYIVAGSDTTANTLTYLIWEVCRHPAVKARLVAELRGLPADWSEADLRKLPYLGCVIDEALRRYSAVPSALPRVVPSQGADLAGYFVPGGTVVCAQAFSMHLNPSIYPSPQSFDPSRWENPTKEMKDSFFAFGGGSRGEPLPALYFQKTNTNVPFSLPRQEPGPHRASSRHGSLLPRVSQLRGLSPRRHV
jgi:cytochrome P450